MKKTLIAMALAGMVGSLAAVHAAPVEKLDLKDGTTLFLHEDGTSHMVDAHGEPMSMDDGVEMELKDGRTMMMKNKKIWVTYGPPGKGTTVLKATGAD